MVISEPERYRDGVRLATLLGGEVAQHVLRRAVEQPRDDVSVMIDAAAARLSQPGGALEALGLESLREATRKRVWRAFDHAVRLWPGLQAPTVESWVQHGLDLGALAAALERDETLELVLAPLGQGADAWITAFHDCEGAPELTLSTEIVAEFDLLEWPLSADVHEGQGASRGPEASLTIGDTRWALAALPAASAPPELGQNHRHGPHPRLPEMLTLQLMRALDGGSFVDRSTFTWIAGRLGEGRLAARHVYDEYEHSIRVSTREWAQQGPHQGARHPLVPPRF